MKNTNFAVGGYWHCDKCGEEYHSSRHHTCEPPVTAHPDEGDNGEYRKLKDAAWMELTQGRTTSIPHPYFSQGFAAAFALIAASDLAIAEAYRCGYESGKSEVEALRQLVAFYQGEGAHDIPEEAEYRELASIDPNSRSEKQTERLRELANVLRDNFDIESLQSQLAAGRTLREELKRVFVRNIKMHENSPVFTPGAFTDDTRHELRGFIRGLNRGLEIVTLHFRAAQDSADTSESGSDLEANHPESSGE